MEEYWYRYEDYLEAPPLDQFDEHSGEATLRITLRKFKVTKHTPKGVKLIQVFGDFTSSGPERLVLNKAHKKYACPSKEEARISFLARKKKQLLIHQARCRQAEAAIHKMKGS